MSKRLFNVVLSLFACVALLPGARLVGQSSTAVTQITFGSGCGSEYPSLNASGNRVVFESFCDLLPGSNPGGITQIFTVNSDGNGIVQMTHGTNHSGNASFDANGDAIAFESFADLVAGQNTDANNEIFTINSDGTGLTQLTHSTGGVFVGAGFLANFLPNFNYSGRQIVFVSGLDLVGSGDTDQSPEIFVMNSDGSGVRQLTNTPGGGNSSSPSTDPSGREVFFLSDGDWDGTNPQRNTQLFRMNIDGTGIAQLTQAGGPGLNLNEKSSVDASGINVVFTSKSDLVSGQNSDGNSEVFLLNTRTGQITQITNTSGGRGCFAPSISASGRIVAFSCDRDLVGTNPGLSTQVFLARLR